MTDLYAILNVPPDASADDIKKAYRQLSKKYHPDLNPQDPDAPNKIIEINKAYAVLSDPDARSSYDYVLKRQQEYNEQAQYYTCLLYTSPSPRD